MHAKLFYPYFFKVATGNAPTTRKPADVFLKTFLRAANLAEPKKSTGLNHL